MMVVVTMMAVFLVRIVLHVGGSSGSLLKINTKNFGEHKMPLKDTSEVVTLPRFLDGKAPPPGAKKEICALVQTVAAEDDDNVVISVHFLKYSDGSRVLRIFTPLGVALAKGMRLNIDDTQSVQASYSRCAQYGCFAQIEPDDKLFELLKTSKRVLVVIYRTEEAGIGIPISLAAFNQGLAALQ